MTKGTDTRTAILDHATDVATHRGLEGLSIGQLATDLGLSKSGLFAHFQSKEALQVAVVDTAAARFAEAVVRPGLRAPRGLPRLRALFDLWLTWGAANDAIGGCFFVAATTELDDRPGPVRDALVRTQRDWLELLAGAARAGVTEGHLRADTDPDQVAFSLYGVVFAFQHRARLLREPDAVSRARQAAEQVIRAVCAP